VYFAMRFPRPRVVWRAVALGVMLVGFAQALQAGPMASIVRRAAGIPKVANGLEGFVNAADALITPALVAMAAITPLGCILGAGAVAFGSRRGMVIIGSSLGALIFLGSIKGIVA
jgi:hypothetical protein